MRLASVGSDYDFAITKAEKGIDQSLALKTLITGVEVTAHNIVEGTGKRELYHGYLASGSHEITFDQPMHTLTITGGIITESGANYAIVSSTGASVILSGLVYIDTRKTYSVYNNTISTAVKPNIIKVTNASLVNSSNAAAITQRMYDYYQQRLSQKMKLYASTIATGDMALIETLYSKQIRGLVEKMDIDLAMGMVEQAEIVGVAI
jgi:hypothetical protein